MDEELYKRRIERERQARKQAEALLEQKSLELYEANMTLKHAAENLEKEVILRTQDLNKAKEIECKMTSYTNGLSRKTPKRYSLNILFE